MRGTPITGSSRGVSITDTVSRAQRILQDRPEPRGRDRYANRTNRPPRNGGDGAKPASGDGAAREADQHDTQPDDTQIADGVRADASPRPAE